MAQAPSGTGGTGSKPNVTPRDIWNELEFQGASSIQAAAIMGNAIAESSLDPETAVTDSNGYKSYGLWQFNSAPGNYPNAASLVTGNPLKDMRAQIKFLFQNGGLKAASGDTVPKAASAFASGFERCKTCGSGGTSNKQRQGYATKVAGWASSGNWPTSSGAASDSASLDTASSQQSSESCAWGLNLDPLPSWVPFVGGPGTVCIVSKPQLRALIGAGIMVGGVLLGLAGVAMLTGATSKVARGVLAIFPETRAAAVASAPASSRSAPASPRRGTVADERGTSPEFRAQFLGG